jgi:methionyl-tRNA formyltransferase
MKVVFFGRGNVATPCLQLLQQQSWCNLVQVVTTDDFSNVPAADVGVIVDFGFKLPEAVLAHFPHGIINVHPSLLPRWRGPSPIKTALLHGDTTTGVTIMKIDTGLDTGPILIQQATPIQLNETNAELEPRLAKLGAELLVQVLPGYVNGEIMPQAQAEGNVTISHLIKRVDGELTETLTAVDMWNRYRAYQPWPGIFFIHEQKRYKITAAHWQDDHFVCDAIQPEGKKAMSLADFKRGYRTVSFADVV